MQNKDLPPLSQEARSLVAGDLYEHFKGGRYKIVAVGRSSETLEELVIYQALYGEHGIWVRPLKMFLEKVEVHGQLRPRFKKMG